MCCGVLDCAKMRWTNVRGLLIAKRCRNRWDLKQEWEVEQNSAKYQSLWGHSRPVYYKFSPCFQKPGASWTVYLCWHILWGCWLCAQSLTFECQVLDTQLSEAKNCLSVNRWTVEWSSKLMWAVECLSTNCRVSHILTREWNLLYLMLRYQFHVICTVHVHVWCGVCQ